MKNENSIGIVLNYVLIVVSNISSLLIAPILIGGMGERLYGIYFLVFSISTFLIAVDFGMGTAVIRNIVKMRSRKDRIGLENYLFQALWIYAVFALVVFIFCAGMYICSPYIFQNFSMAEIDIFKKTFIIMVLNSLLVFIQNFLFSVITGFERLVFTRFCNIVKVIFRTVIFFLVITNTNKPHFFFMADLCLSAAIDVASLIYVVIKMKVRIKFHSADKPTIKKDIRKMAMLYGMPLSENAYWAVCSVVIGITLGTESVTKFGIATTFCIIYTQLATTISNFKMPHVSALWFTKRNNSEYQNYVFGSGRTQSMLLGGVLIAFVVFGKSFLMLWLGSGFDITYYLTLFMMASLFLPLSQSMLEIESYVRSNYTGRMVLLFLAIPLNVALLWIGTRWFELPGAAGAVVVTTLAFKLVGMDVYYQKIGISVKAFITYVQIKIFPAMIISGISAILLITIAVDYMLIQIIGGAVVTLIYLFLIVKTYMPDEQKQIFLNRRNKYRDESKLLR